MTPKKTPPKKKPVGLPTREEVRDYLESKHCVLWGRSITIVKEGTDVAVDYIFDTIADFETWRGEKST
jgi:hypothetical protein